MTVAGLLAAAPSVEAEEYIIVNGLPCGSFCRAWTGLSVPAPHEPADGSDADVSAPIRSEDAKQNGRRAHRSPAAHRDQDANAAPSETAHHRVRLAHHTRERLAEKRSDGKGSRVEDSEGDAKSAPAAAKEPSAGLVSLHKKVTETRPSGSAAAEQASAPRRAPAKEKPVANNHAPSIAITPPASEAKDRATAEGAEQPARAATSAAPKPSVAAAPSASEAKGGIAAAPSASETKDRAAAEGPEQPTEAAKSVAPAPSPEPSVAPSPAASNSASSADDVAGKSPPPSPDATAGDLRTTEPQVAIANQPAQSAAPRQVLIVLAKPDFQDVPDLHDQTIVVAGVDSVSGEQLAASFAAAGAKKLTFKSGDLSAVNQLFSGKVAAAIVAATAPEVAAAFQTVPGYRLMLVDLSSAGSR